MPKNILSRLSKIRAPWWGAFGLLSLIKPVLFVVDRLAEADYVAQHLGAVGGFLNTGWGTLATVGGGFVIVGFAVYRGLQPTSATTDSTAVSRPEPPNSSPVLHSPLPRLLQADVDFFGSYVRGFEALAIELELGSPSRAFLEERRKRCDDLYATVKNYLTANRVRLGFERLLRFSSAHPTEAFQKQEGWPEAQYQPWAKASRSALHLRDFLTELGEAKSLPAPEILRTAHIASLQSAERERAAKKLVSLTEDEERFLDLFVVDAIPMVPGQTQTYLANAVYRAGEHLVSSGILTRNTNKDGKERFRLSEATSMAWNSGGRTSRPRRESVDIDLEAVWGTGASGSGAGPGGFSRYP